MDGETPKRVKACTPFDVSSVALRASRTAFFRSHHLYCLMSAGERLSPAGGTSEGIPMPRG